MWKKGVTGLIRLVHRDKQRHRAKRGNGAARGNAAVTLGLRTGMARNFWGVTGVEEGCGGSMPSGGTGEAGEVGGGEVVARRVWFLIGKEVRVMPCDVLGVLAGLMSAL
jgi:hypothetical protein